MFLQAFLWRAMGALNSYLKCIKDYGVDSTFSVISYERFFIYSYELFIFKNSKFQDRVPLGKTERLLMCESSRS